MNRRDLLVGTAAGAASLLAVNGALHAAAVDKHDHMEHCAEDCQKCESECLHCSNHCVEEIVGGHKDHADCLKHCLDCADACQLCASVMSRGGPNAKAVAKLCAEICDRCAEQCEKFKNDKHCAECAKVCRHCAEECRAAI
jgi:hypothetical protein